MLLKIEPSETASFATFFCFGGIFSFPPGNSPGTYWLKWYPTELQERLHYEIRAIEMLKFSRILKKINNRTRHFLSAPLYSDFTRY